MLKLLSWFGFDFFVCRLTFIFLKEAKLKYDLGLFRTGFLWEEAVIGIVLQLHVGFCWYFLKKLRTAGDALDDGIPRLCLERHMVCFRGHSEDAGKTRHDDSDILIILTLSLGWLMGTFTGNHGFYHQIWVFPGVFPVKFPKWTKTWTLVVWNGLAISRIPSKMPITKVLIPRSPRLRHFPSMRQLEETAVVLWWPFRREKGPKDEVLIPLLSKF